MHACGIKFVGINVRGYPQKLPAIRYVVFNFTLTLACRYMHPPIAMEATPPPLPRPPPLPYVKLQFVQPPAEYVYPALVDENKVIYTHVNFTATAALTEIRQAREQELSENNHDSSDHSDLSQIFPSNFRYVLCAMLIFCVSTQALQGRIQGVILRG